MPYVGKYAPHNSEKETCLDDPRAQGIEWGQQCYLILNITRKPSGVYVALLRIVDPS